MNRNIETGQTRLAGKGLFNRSVIIGEVVSRLPDWISREEVEGLIVLLPPDTRMAASSLLNQEIQAAGLSFGKMGARWMSEALRAKKEGKKVILVPFNFPVELIYAFEGAFPLCSEVLSTVGVMLLQGQGERYWDYAMGLGIPDSICAASTIEMGSLLSLEDFQPDGIVSSGTGGCDANAKIHEFVANYLNIPQFMLEKPTDNTVESKELYLRYFLHLVEEIEQFVGEELDESRLRGVVEEANVASEMYWDLWELRKPVPCPVHNLFPIFVYGTRFTMWGRKEATDVLRNCVEISRNRMQDPRFGSREELARAIWVYSGYYYDYSDFFDWMQEAGIVYLIDMLNMYFPHIIDTATKDTMLQGIAEAAWNMPMTRQIGGDSMWGRWLEDIVFCARELNANCAIFSGHHSCKQSWSIISIIRNELLERLGMPTLFLQGDSWRKRMTPMSTLQEEIWEFVNNVVLTRRRRVKTKR